MIPARHDTLVNALLKKLENVTRFPKNNSICDLMYKEIVKIRNSPSRSTTRMANKFIAWAETNGRLESIALFTMGSNEFYIDYLCSARPLTGLKCKHVTTRLLAYIHNAAQLVGVNRIALKSTRDAFEYYKKIGMRKNTEDMHFYHNGSVLDSTIHEYRARNNTNISRTDIRMQDILERAKKIVGGRSHAPPAKRKRQG
jgi:hypothetical protein